MDSTEHSTQCEGKQRQRIRRRITVWTTS